MKIIFAGTPQFAAVHLQALLNSPHQVCAVYTQPDKPKGRGRKSTASPVKQLAEDNNIPVMQPKTLRDQQAQEDLANFNADLMVVVAYGLILPKVVLNTPRYGCINVHASLLPRWRGAAPLQHAILAGDKMTGVTIMQMDEGLDTGDMLYKIQCEITDEDTSASLHDKLAEQGSKALLKTLDLLVAGKLTPEKQDEAEACYAHKLTKAQANIDWHQSALEIDQAIRAYNPWPVAYTHYHGEVIRVWQAEKINQTYPSAKPGTIVDITKHALVVMTGEGVLQLTKLQISGSKILSVVDIINGNKVDFQIGQTLDYEA